MDTFSSLAGFVAVIALIPIALWLLKRTPMGGAGAGRGLRSVAALALSGTQRIVTVEVGTGTDRRWLVLGVTPAGIHTLHTMAPQDEAATAPGAPAMPVSAFGELLARLRPHPEQPRAQ